MIVIARLKFELAYYDVAVQLINHYAKSIPPNGCSFVRRREYVCVEVYVFAETSLYECACGCLRMTVSRRKKENVYVCKYVYGDIQIYS